MTGFSSKYLAGVGRLIKAELELRAQKFIKSFDPNRRTVVLLPGGMGSELSNLAMSWSEGNLPGEIPSLPPLLPLWINVATLGRFLEDDAHFLALDENGVELRRFPCVATGALKAPGSPYHKLEAGLRNHVNYVDFGYDWRRSALSGSEMLKYFLDRLDALAVAAGKRSPLPVVLLAHSQGGLIGKVFCERRAIEGPEAIARYFTRFVAVGTPFLGTLDHANRYFSGVASAGPRGIPEFAAMGAMMLAKRRQGNISRREAWVSAIAEWRSMVASMPGLWHLITPSPTLLDENLLEQRGLSRYPLRKGDEAFDFFADPDLYPWVKQFRTGDAVFRYQQDSKLITKLPNDALKERIWYVVGLREPGKCELDYLSPSTLEIDPSRPMRSLTEQPAIVASDNANDNTVPVWSATLNDDNTTTLTGAKISHRKLVANKAVIALVLKLAAGGEPESEIQPEPDDDDDNAVDFGGDVTEAGLEQWATEYFR